MGLQLFIPRKSMSLLNLENVVRSCVVACAAGGCVRSNRAFGCDPSRFIAPIQFVEGFIQAPGSVDLSSWKFSVVSKEDEDFFPEGSRVDVVVFYQPSACSQTSQSCGWASLGVGNSTQTIGINGIQKVTRYCCNQEAIDWKLCDASSYGTLIIDNTKFRGDRRFVEYPPGQRRFVNETLRYGRLPQTKTGQYEIVVANCNDNGRTIHIEGNSVWSSDLE
jgi:hypothetical protein